MNKKIVTGSAIMALCVGLSVSGIAFGDDDGKWGGKNKDKSYGARSATVTAVMNKTYEAECSACHFAYQPGFLPERSWVKIMDNLDDHFGDNAMLDEASHDVILNYLRGHAADRLPQRFSHSLLRSLGEQDTPLRITETRFFVAKHDEVPSRLVKDNPEVRSFSNCQKCHTGADKGFFDEDSVVIAGYGRWDD